MVGHLKRLVSVTAWLLLIALVAATSVVYAQKLELLSVQTGSMRPGIDPGDVVAVHSVPVTELSVGDVITYTPPGADYTVTHRIVDIDRTNNLVTTKGDANNSADAPILAEQINGRVKHVVPFGGYLIQAIGQPLGLLLLIYLPALIVFISEIRHLARYFKRLRPFVLPTDEPNFARESNRSWLNLVSHLFVLGVLVVAISTPAWAQLFDQASLTGNTISVATDGAGDDDDLCNGAAPSCNYSCSSQTSVDVSVSTSQTSQSGDVAGTQNTATNNATSGSADNSSSTSISFQSSACH